MTALREGTVPVTGGRRIGFAEYGDRGGIPCSRSTASPAAAAATSRVPPFAAGGAWLFTLERPGIGLSDPQPGRRLLDWPADVAAVADHLAWDRFAVLGISGGAPYALAAAYALPERVTAETALAVAAGRNASTR